MAERRFLVAPDSIEIGGEPIAIVSGSEHDHLRRVLRLSAGDAVSVFDGQGRGFLGRVEKVERDRSVVRLTAPDERRVEPETRIILAQAIPHHDKMDLVVQKTTELGISRIVPLLTERTVVRPARRGGWSRVERWRRIAAEASRQSRRLVVPRVDDPVSWRDLLAGDPAGPADPRFLFGPSEEEAPGEGAALGISPGTRAVLLAVGPEGGWSPAESASGLEAGYRPVSLGPRTLRAETAGIVAVALALFLAGDLRPGPS